jgi:transcriptional regulator GlxA family with amidase domain
MHRVLAHIDAHLDQPLDLATLADVAHFSPFHFHRLFSAWMGETFGDYLRRRRVELAAMRLAAQPRARILNISLSGCAGIFRQISWCPVVPSRQLLQAGNTRYIASGAR